ncbi:hypothetical protein D3C72_2360120 [compost metagenome]
MARAYVACFFAHYAGERRKPFYPAQMHQCRQQRNEQSGVGRLEDEIAAEQAHVRFAVLPAMANFADR